MNLNLNNEMAESAALPGGAATKCIPNIICSSTSVGRQFSVRSVALKSVSSFQNQISSISQKKRKRKRKY